MARKLSLFEQQQYILNIVRKNTGSSSTRVVYAQILSLGFLEILNFDNTLL